MKDRDQITYQKASLCLLTHLSEERGFCWEIFKLAPMIAKCSLWPCCLVNKLKNEMRLKGCPGTHAEQRR